MLKSAGEVLKDKNKVTYGTFQFRKKMNPMEWTQRGVINDPGPLPSRLHELHESKLTFCSLLEFLRSKISLLFTHVTGVNKVRNWPARILSSRRIASKRKTECLPSLSIGPCRSYLKLNASAGLQLF